MSVHADSLLAVTSHSDRKLDELASITDPTARAIAVERYMAELRRLRTRAIPIRDEAIRERYRAGGVTKAALGAEIGISEGAVKAALQAKPHL